ncbi:MAG: hypothetical protein HYV32_06795 [Candidatus Kerfeldbacteria bacterium]|nr:hypothetical protein [Candidatus Kerfeldbacteria bacterium]
MKNFFRLFVRPKQAAESIATAQPAPMPTQEVLVYKATATRRLPNLAQLRYLPRMTTRMERLLFSLMMALFLLSIIVFSIRAYYRFTEMVPTPGGSYTEGLVGAPQYINPLLSSLSDVDADLARLIFPSIFHYNDQQQLESDVITNYVVSDDGLTYTFFLRSDVQWNDGERLDADDVLFTISAIQDPLTKSPLRSSLKDVAAEKVDDYSFTLKLKQAYAPFLSSLTFGILPEHVWYNIPLQNIRLTALNLQPVGAGPYQFQSLTKDQAGNVKSIELVRNDDYYGKKPYINELHFIFYPDIATATTALENKNIEGLAFLPQSSRTEVEKKIGHLQFHSLRIPQYTAVFFNEKQSAVLQNDTVRAALATATDRDSIIRDVLGGEGAPVYTPILPGYSGYNADVEKYAFDLEKSKQLLQDGGWVYPENAESSNAAGQGDFIPREKDGTKLEFTLSTVDLPEYQQTVTMLKNNWQAIGVKVNVTTVAPEEMQTQVIKKRSYDALLFGQIIGTDPDPYPFWHSSQQEHPGLALSIFLDRDINQLLEDARKTTSADERAAKYVDFQNKLAADIPAIFLYNPLYTYAVNEKMQGLSAEQYINIPSDRFSQIAHWYVKTNRQRKK